MDDSPKESSTPWGPEDEPGAKAAATVLSRDPQPSPPPEARPPAPAANGEPFPPSARAVPAASEEPPGTPDAEVPSGSGQSLPSEPEPYGEDDFEQEAEPFDQPGAEKLGIVGGKGVGKSYLFQAIVYRTYAGAQSGALTYYLDGIRLFRALKRSDAAQTMNLARFVKKYASWERLPTTIAVAQEWYRLRLRYRTGIFGGERSALDVEFFDGSGEGFFEAARTPENRKLWREGYLKARVMVFCLPIWAAFPGDNLKREDWQKREELIEGFEQVVQNYTDMRTLNGQTQPVCSILALTQADDRRSGLQALRDRWIQPYMDSPHTYLRQLRRGSGIARYLANARTVSAALHEEFDAARDPQVAAIPESLDFGRGRPWLIPVSAIEGGLLDSVAGQPEAERDPAPYPPVPVHVELPLLVALCERDNALM